MVLIIACAVIVGIETALIAPDRIPGLRKKVDKWQSRRRR